MIKIAKKVKTTEKEAHDRKGRLGVNHSFFQEHVRSPVARFCGTTPGKEKTPSSTFHAK